MELREEVFRHTVQQKLEKLLGSSRERTERIKEGDRALS